MIAKTGRFGFSCFFLSFPIPEDHARGVAEAFCDLPGHLIGFKGFFGDLFQPRHRDDVTDRFRTFDDKRLGEPVCRVDGDKVRQGGVHGAGGFFSSAKDFRGVGDLIEDMIGDGAVPQDGAVGKARRNGALSE